MATPASYTLREGEFPVELEKTPIHAEVDQKMDDDSADEGDVLLDLQGEPSHAEARVKTLREGEVPVEVEKTPIHAEVDQKMDGDSADEGDALLDLQGGPSHAEARVETSRDTSGGVDDRSHGEPEPPSQPETHKKVDFVLVYETFTSQDNEAEDVEGQKTARDDKAILRETFEQNLEDAGLRRIGSQKAKPSPVSSLTLLFL